MTTCIRCSKDKLHSGKVTVTHEKALNVEVLRLQAV